MSITHKDVELYKAQLDSHDFSYRFSADSDTYLDSSRKQIDLWRVSKRHKLYGALFGLYSATRGKPDPAELAAVIGDYLLPVSDEQLMTVFVNPASYSIEVADNKAAIRKLLDLSLIKECSAASEPGSWYKLTAQAVTMLLERKRKELFN